MIKEKEEFISIIIPVCGGLKYLKKTIPKLTKLNYSNYEVIVADNSKDNTISKYLERENVNYIRTVPGSKTIAANNAVKFSKGKYLLFLDADAFVQDKNILKNLNFEIRKNINVCYSIAFKNINGEYFGNGGKLFMPSRIIKELFKNKSNYDKKLIDYPQGFAFFLKKDVWKDIGGYDETIPFGCEEIDIGFKLKSKNIKCNSYNNIVLLDLGIPQGKIKSDLDSLELDSEKFGQMIFGKIYFLKKYYSVFDFYITILFLFLIHLFLTIKKTWVNGGFKYIKQLFKAYFGLFKTRTPLKKIKKRV